MVAIVSSSLDLPWEEELFGESTITPIVFTDGSASAENQRKAREVQSDGRVEIITCASLPADALEVLRARGYSRIVCEGGPRLLQDLFPLIHEIDLTIAPLLLGTQEASVEKEERPNQVNWNLDYIWDHEGFIFNKYVRA